MSARDDAETIIKSLLVWGLNNHLEGNGDTIVDYARALSALLPQLIEESRATGAAGQEPVAWTATSDSLPPFETPVLVKVKGVGARIGALFNHPRIEGFRYWSDPDDIDEWWDDVAEEDVTEWLYIDAPISPAVIRKEALEEAAKVAETIFYGLSIEEWNGMTKKEHATRACLECAKAIRALQSTPHQEDK